MVRTRAASATQNDASEETEEAAKPSKYHPCACMTGTGQQCPEETTKKFYRGHDAKMSSRIAQGIVNGDYTLEKGLGHIEAAGGSELLVGKTKRSVQLRQEKRAGKENQSEGEATENGKPTRRTRAQRTDDKAKTQVGKEVKVHHDGPPARDYKAVVVRNAAGELKARHRVKGQDCDHDVAV